LAEKKSIINHYKLIELYSFMFRRFEKTRICVFLQDVSTIEVTESLDWYLIFYMNFRDLIFYAKHT